MDVQNFACDWKNEIFGINTCLTYMPFIALGAVIIGSDKVLIKITKYAMKIGKCHNWSLKNKWNILVTQISYKKRIGSFQ